MSLATVSAQQTAATATSQGMSSSSATLAGNFNDFLKLLMTQLQNQDPTSPLDTNQFTSQLVQFASVEQQINANSNLTQLIQLTQGEQVLQASSLVGRSVAVSADHIPLQNGAGMASFTTAMAQPVLVTITSDTGVKVRDAVINANAGINQWTWDGRNNAGTQMPDGSYKISMADINTDGSTTAQPFTVNGTVTGITNQNGAAQLLLGTQAAAITSVQQVIQ